MTAFRLTALATLLLGACASPPLAPDAPTPVATASARVATTWVRPSPIFPSPRPSLKQSAEAPPAAGTTTVSGLVTADSGNPLYGAGVSVQSLDPKRPFSERVIAEKGRFTITGVPVGVMVKVAANIRFYEPRSLMHTTAADPAANVVEFAGPYALRKL